MMASLLRGLALVWVLMWLGASPAAAGFGNCNDRAYVSLFDERLGASGDFMCVESERTPVTSDAGTRHIRIVQHLLSDWATRPGAMASFKDGVLRATQAMRTIGSFRISDVTILLVDGFGPGVSSETFGSVAAWTSYTPGNECRITIWLLGLGATAANGASVVEHELFHCIQVATLTHEQMTSGDLGTSGGGSWWLEGSADWFSTVAGPAPGYMADRVAAFDKFSPTRSLNQMTYDAFVFFAWLGRPPTRVMPFLRHMASSSSETAQWQAMAGVLDEAGWLEFTQAYLDRTIRDGQGAPIGSTPVWDVTYEWAGTRTQRVAIAPFLLHRARLDVHCGRWTFADNPRRYHVVRPEDGGTWTVAMPGNIDAMDGNAKVFRLGTMNTSSSAVSLSLAGTQQSRCAECGGTHEVDRCLVGTWRMTADGAARWMRENIHKANVTGISQEGTTITLNPDGTFSTGASNVSATLEGSGNTHGRGQMSGQAGGRWSAAAGRFNMCQDARTQSGTITVNQNGHTITVPVPQQGPGSASMTYRCSTSSFETKMGMPRGTEVTNTYEKISGPPSP